METTAAATCCATLVDQWVRDGVRHAIVCPGSRSTPLALALADRPDVAIHIHHDERSAGFVALGQALATGEPALVVTTSGTAAVELHPAVVEAAHAGVPLIACTADRPPELQGVGAPQTIDQRELYGTAARHYVAVGVPDHREASSWRPLARVAYTEATGSDPGPVQVNLAFRDPLVGAPGALPSPIADLVAESEPAALVEPALLAGRRGVVVAGGGVTDPETVVAVAARLGWPLLADPRSGARWSGSIAHADALLRIPRFADRHRPEVVLRVGSLPASKVVTGWLASSGATEIGVGHRLDDPARTVALRTTGHLRGLLGSLGPASAADPGWLDSWQRAERAAEGALSALDRAGLTEPAIARTVAAAAPRRSRLMVSSSMPVRDVEWYSAPRDDLTVYANRGANGIDGVVSTAVGLALSGEPVTLLVGDVALVHDTNGLLGAVERNLDLTVVVVDNRGGGIFSFLPQAEMLDPERFELLFGTPHDVDLVGLATAHRAQARRVDTLAELADGVATRGPGVRVLVARTDRALNVVEHDALHASIAEAVGEAFRDERGR